MIGWLLILALALLFAIFAWLRGRPAKWILPSDAFLILCFLIAGTVPFVNLHATSPLYVDYPYSDASVQTALVCLTLMFSTFAIFWMVRPKIALPDLLPHSDPVSWKLRLKDAQAATLLIRTGTFLLVAVSILLLAYGPYLSYKSEVLLFLTGQISAEDYRTARRVTFAGDFVIEGLMGRLRFGIFPMFFVGLSMMAVRRLGLVAGFAVAAVIFAIGPASMSKAPIVVYLLYFSIAVLLMRNLQWPLKAKNAVLVLAVSLTFLLAILTGTYFLQYRGIYFGSDSLPDALRLSYFRVFVATYDTLLKYLTVYPGGDIGVAGSIVAPLFGEETRNLDAEVARFFLGPIQGQYTSYPTIFIGNAYASFGYVGVVLYSAAVAFILWVIDLLFVSIQNRDLRIIFYATMTVNVAFFAVLAAPTALLTYGNAIMPLLIFAADRGLGSLSRRYRPSSLSDARPFASRTP